VIDPEASAELPSDCPLISVIVPAHNEEAEIRACLDSVLEQDYPHYEIIVVNDRSVDQTASIAGDVAAGSDKVKVISVEDLPEGWTGKCHALSVGVLHAGGDWLAFLDADSRLHPSGLRHSYRTALDRGVSMVTLSPRPILRTFWDKTLLPIFMGMSSLLFPLEKINDPESNVASANGMFFLIDRTAYDMIGGHGDVKDLAVEDIGIGKRIKAAGLGLVFANGRNVLVTRMYDGFGEILQGWTRILAASMNYSLLTVVRHLFVQSVTSLPVVAVALYFYIPAVKHAWPNTWFILPVVLALQILVVMLSFYPQLGVPRKYCGLLSVGNLFVIWVLLVICKRILFNDALQWRGTTYSMSRYQPCRLDPEPADFESVPQISDVMAKVRIANNPISAFEANREITQAARGRREDLSNHSGLRNS
jgi:chlorobactene glucosyltransferase